ncbi:MAG: thioesterase family protein [Odoribacter sp.]|nr:thioesterase family protein [Odoribacter sp.]
MIEIGMSFTQDRIVEHKDTALVYGSGNLEVYATPAMVAFMENTAVKCLQGMLEEGEDTVGIEINVNHLKATAVGKKVTCTASINEKAGRRIGFVIKVSDENGTVGTATHSRFIINPEKFMSKL